MFLLWVEKAGNNKLIKDVYGFWQFTIHVFLIITLRLRFKKEAKMQLLNLKHDLYQ